MSNNVVLSELESALRNSRKPFNSMKHLIKGFYIYRQRRPCAMEFHDVTHGASSVLWENYGYGSVFIIIMNLKICLITNEWYARNEHYYFRNLRSFRRGTTGPLFIITNDADPRSVFVAPEKKSCTTALLITSETTMFSYFS